MAEDLTKIEALTQADPEALDLLKLAMEKRKRAWELEHEAEELKREAIQELEVALTVPGISGAKDEFLGSASLIPEGTTKRLDTERFKQELLSHGVLPVIIAQCSEGATKVSPRQRTIRYEPPGRGIIHEA